MRKILGTITIILILLGTNACGTGHGAASESTVSAAMTWQEHYDLGIRYLSDGNYQEAIIAFTSAIEIEPQRADAYVGRGDVYFALATEHSDDAATGFENAAVDYNKALELIESASVSDEASSDLLNEQEIRERLAAIWERWADIALLNGEKDAAIERYEAAAEMTDDPAQKERLEAAITEIEDEIQSEARVEIQKQLTSGMWDAASQGNVFYDFNDDGTGRVISLAEYGITNTFSYQIANDAVSVMLDTGENEIWTCAADSAGFIKQDTAHEREVKNVRIQNVYHLWGEAITDFADDGFSNVWMSQRDMNLGSHQVCEYWDQLLNEVYQHLKATLPEAEFQALRDDERAWIAKKDAAVEEAGKVYEGGSMRPLIENDTAASWTQERVDYLIGLIPEE